jgi:hypothetical protein
MRMPKVRLSLRQLMLCVAVMAISLEAWILAARALDYRNRSTMLAGSAASMRRVAGLVPQHPSVLVVAYSDGSPLVDRRRERALSVAAHYDQLARIYARAALRPWRAVPPLPPEP